jgi:hypothetical protein
VSEFEFRCNVRKERRSAPDSSCSPRKAAQGLLSSVVLASIVVTLSAQTPTPTFEVASIRSNPSGGRRGWDYKGETFTISNLPVADIVRIAYGIGTSSL